MTTNRVRKLPQRVSEGSKRPSGCAGIFTVAHMCFCLAMGLGCRYGLCKGHSNSNELVDAGCWSLFVEGSRDTI